MRNGSSFTRFQFEIIYACTYKQMQIKKILIYIYTNDLISDMYNTPFFSPHKTIMCGSLQGSIIYFKKIYDCNQDITNGEMSIRQNVNDYFLMKGLHQVYKKENSEESGRWKKSLWFFKHVVNLFHFCVYSITRKRHQKFTLMLDLQL